LNETSGRRGFRRPDPADLVELSEEELGRLTGDEILELAESLGLHLDVNISREAALARLRLLSVE